MEDIETQEPRQRARRLLCNRLKRWRSGSGQKAKASSRANLLCFTPESRPTGQKESKAEMGPIADIEAGAAALSSA
jgi:hypothetical protein